MTLGQTIRKLRKEADMTQERLAELLNVSPQAVSRWETDSAMPDIVLLAPIANLFNVTTDSLLGVDIERKYERINEIIKKANEAMCQNNNDRWYNAAKILRDGLKLYPDSWKLKSMLAFMLPTIHCGEEEHLANCREANSISEEIAAYCPDRQLQYQAVERICKLAGLLDNRRRAVELAQTMPLIHQCRELLLLGNIEVGSAENHIKNVIHTMYVHMTALIYNLAMTKNTPEEIHALYEKEAAVSSALYEGDDFIKSGILGDSAMEWADQFARVGDYEMAFKMLSDDLRRIEYISENKLNKFAYLSPDYLTKQVEERNTDELRDELRYHVSDYIKFIDRYFPDGFKSDDRCREIIEKYGDFIKKMSDNMD